MTLPIQHELDFSQAPSSSTQPSWDDASVATAAANRPSPQAHLQRADVVLDAVMAFANHPETFDAKIVNLSLTGLCLQGPAGLIVKDRLFCDCLLGAGQPLTRLPAEVVWVKAKNAKTSLYGLKFVELPPQSRAQLQLFFKTWYTPSVHQVLPLPKSGTKTVLRHSSPTKFTRSLVWVLGVLLIGNVGLWLLQSGYWERGSIELDLPEVVVDKPVVAPAPAAPVPISEQPMGEHELRVKSNAQQVQIMLPFAQPAVNVNSFWLDEPTRLVMDVVQNKTMLDGVMFNVAHPLLHRLRVGNHPNKVRFVFETPTKLKHHIAADHPSNSLKITFEKL